MRVSVVRNDGLVYVDGEPAKVDLAEIPAYISAVQWDGASGHIEFAADDQGRAAPNVKLTDFDAYQFVVARWQKARDDERKRLEAVAAQTREQEEIWRKLQTEQKLLQHAEVPALTKGRTPRK